MVISLILDLYLTFFEENGWEKIQKFCCSSTLIEKQLFFSYVNSN